MRKLLDKEARQRPPPVPSSPFARMSPSRSFTEGPIGPTLLRLSVPMIAGLLSTFLYVLADAYFVAQLGTLPLAAIGFTYPVTWVFGGTAVGIGVGLAAVVARAYGQGNRALVRRITTDGLLLGLLLISALAVLGALTVEPVFRLLGATPEVMPYLRAYMPVWYLSCPLMAIPMIGNNAIRAGGDFAVTSYIMMSGAALNVILDPLLIFGAFGLPGLGIEGAAWATALARLFTVFFALYVLNAKKGMLARNLPRRWEVLDSWKKIARVGLPVACNSFIAPISVAILLRLVAAHGEEAVAGYAAGDRSASLFLVPFFAMGASLIPFIGQNYGAGKMERIRRTWRLAMLYSLLYGLGMVAVLAAFAGLIASLFSDNEAVLTVARQFFYIMPWGLLGMGVLQVTHHFLPAVGRPVLSTCFLFFRLVLLMLPLSLLGSKLFGVAGVFGGYAAAGVLSLFIGYALNRWTEQRMEAPA